MSSRFKITTDLKLLVYSNLWHWRSLCENLIVQRFELMMNGIAEVMRTESEIEDCVRSLDSLESLECSRWIWYRSKIVSGGIEMFSSMDIGLFLSFILDIYHQNSHWNGVEYRQCQHLTTSICFPKCHWTDFWWCLISVWWHWLDEMSCSLIT